MKHKLLITDDEQSVRIFLKDLFIEEGFDVCEAKDGKETLEVVRNETPQIMILDLKLPDINGLELIPQLKKEQPLVEVIIITALGTAENAGGQLESGQEDVDPDGQVGDLAFGGHSDGPYGLAGGSAGAAAAFCCFSRCSLS